jgi:hypothetical protein
LEQGNLSEQKKIWREKIHLAKKFFSLAKTIFPYFIRPKDSQNASKLFHAIKRKQNKQVQKENRVKITDLYRFQFIFYFRLSRKEKAHQTNDKIWTSKSCSFNDQ